MCRVGTAVGTAWTILLGMNVRSTNGPAGERNTPARWQISQTFYYRSSIVACKYERQHERERKRKIKAGRQAGGERVLPCRRRLKRGILKCRWRNIFDLS